MQKIKDYFKRPMNVIILIIIIIYVVFGIRRAVNANSIISDCFIAEEQEITLDNGDNIILYPNNIHTNYEYVAVLSNMGDYWVIYSESPYYVSSTPYSSAYSLYVPLDSKYCYHIDESIKCNSSVGLPSYFSGTDIVWSNHNILTDSGELFFQRAPFSTVGVANLNPNQIARMTLKGIGGIVAVCLVSVIGLVGFRKAWKFLKTALQQA